MNSLKWIKDNWVIIIGSVLVLSTLSLEMTYSFYGFEILNYLDAQEIVLIFFKSFINLNFIFWLLGIYFFSHVKYNLETEELENKYNYKKRMSTLTFVKFFAILGCSLYIFLSYPLVADKRFLKMTEHIYYPFIITTFLGVVDLLFEAKIPKTWLFGILKNITLIYMICLTMVFHNIRIVEQNAFMKMIYKLEKTSFETSYYKFVIFQSKNLVVFYDSIEKSTSMIPMDEIKSIEYCK